MGQVGLAPAGVLRLRFARFGTRAWLATGLHQPFFVGGIRLEIPPGRAGALARPPPTGVARPGGRAGKEDVVTEPSPYDMALAQYDRAVKHLSVRRGIEAYLRVPRR
jgi:hypothetical protein